MIGLVVGLCTLWAWSGTAAAEGEQSSTERDRSERSGLVESLVDEVLAPVSDEVLAPVSDAEAVAEVGRTVDAASDAATPITAPVTESAAAAVEPVARSVAPVVEPVLDPVVRAAEPVVQPVVEALAPVSAPVLDRLDPVTAPALGAVRQAAAPVADAVAPGIEALDPIVGPIAAAVDPAIATTVDLVDGDTIGTPPDLETISLSLSSDAVPSSATTPVSHRSVGAAALLAGSPGPAPGTDGGAAGHDPTGSSAPAPAPTPTPNRIPGQPLPSLPVPVAPSGPTTFVAGPFLAVVPAAVGADRAAGAGLVDAVDDELPSSYVGRIVRLPG